MRFLTSFVRDAKGRDTTMMSESFGFSLDVGGIAGGAEGVRGEKEEHVEGNAIEEEAICDINGSIGSEVDIEG